MIDMFGVSSVASIVIAPFHGPYSSAKIALNALSDALRLELRPFSVQVSVLLCGSIKTPIWETGGDLSGDIWADQPDEVAQLYGAQYAQLGRYFNDMGQAGSPPEVD